MDDARLVRMANQIGANFAAYPAAVAARSIADHLARFWTPAMRAQLQALRDDPALAAPVRAVLAAQPERPPA